MPAFRVKVRLSEIVSGENPRQDFGDIDALAATIEATGGEPVNPPVVVEDGNRYRLVDGERRVRALRKIHDEQDLVAVIAFDEYDEAESAVAMVATDDKKGLTEAERARGFQRMLKLDVPTVTIARATRRKADEVRKAMAVAKEAPEQATMDQMICAAEFEREEDRAAVLSANPESYQRKAETIRRRIEDERDDAEMRSKLEVAGIKVIEGDEAPDGYRDVESIYDPRNADTRVSDALAECGADTLVGYKRGSWWRIATSAPVPEEERETEEQRAARELRERREAAIEALRKALMREIATTDVMPKTLAACGRLRPRGYDYNRDNMRRKLVDDFGVREDLVDAALSAPASTYELLRFVNRNKLYWWSWVCEIVPAACDDGFEMSEEDAWLLELARTERERQEAEQAAEAEEDEDDDE